MEDILKEITGMGGVIAAFVCTEEGKIVAGWPASVADSANSVAVGRIAMRALSSLAALGTSAPDEMDLSYEKGRLMVRQTGPESALVIICQPSINAVMLKLQTVTAVRSIAAIQEAAAHEPAPKTTGDRVKETLEAALGEKAGKFLVLASAAGESVERLSAAGAEAVRFAKLFLGRDKAEALRTQLRLVLGRDI